LHDSAEFWWRFERFKEQLPADFNCVLNNDTSLGRLTVAGVGVRNKHLTLAPGTSFDMGANG